MPTPFMHLWLSEELRLHALSKEENDGRLPEALLGAWPAFYLGSVAPDYQTICGIPRAETHFYTMPPESIAQGWRNFLAAYPELYPGRSLAAEQGAFIAAYLMHLHLDLLWHFDVVLPYFANTELVGDFRNGYLLHLVYLTAVDQLALGSLPDSAQGDLAAAEYDRWLPFASNDEMLAWRDFLQRQMGPDALTQTIEIFAARLQMTPDEFGAKLNDPDWMDRELYSLIPVAKIERHLLDSIPGCYDLVEAYWNGRIS